MKLLFKQRFFSWLDSYDVYDENGKTVYTVQGKLSWGHLLEIHDAFDWHVGTVREEALAFLPRFALYIQDQKIGGIKKEFTFFKPVFSLDCNGWSVQGDIMEWDYQVHAPDGRLVMRASKEIWNWADTYSLVIEREEDALLCLMIVLAIDAAKCSRGND